jgi:hypothetical protein
MTKNKFNLNRFKPHFKFEGPSSRDKQLNVIYFVDSNQTRSFKIPLKYAFVMGGFLAVIAVWSVFSTIFLLQSLSAAAVDQNKIVSLRTVIFDQQTRLDQVYEKAYPDNTNEIAKMSDGDGGAPSPATAEGQEIRQDAPRAASGLKGGLAAKVDAVDEAPQQKEPAHVKIETVRLKNIDSQMELNFAIRNLDSPKQKDGYVIGVAKYVKADGSISYFTAPPNSALSSQGTPTQLKSGFRFSIKYYKERTLLFPLPEDRGGAYKSISIHTLDDKDNQSNFELDVADLLASAKAATPQESGEKETASHSPDDEDQPLIND